MPGRRSSPPSRPGCEKRRFRPVAGLARRGVLQIYLPIAELPVAVFLIFAMGGAIGFISGMFGVGGGFLMTPLLIFIGIPAPVAGATGGAQIAASSLTGVLSYWRRRAIDVRLGLVLVAGGLIGTVLGVLFFNGMRRVGQLELVINLSYVTLLSSVGGLMLVESLRSFIRRRRGRPMRRRRAGQHRWYEKLPWRMRFARSKIYVSIIPLLALGISIGFTGTLLGIGGGFMIVPALIYFFRVPTAVVIGTSLFQILATMIAATMLHAVTNHQVDIVLALILIVGGVIGAQFGTRAGQNINAGQFRLLLALLICAVAARFAFEIAVQPDDPYSLSPLEIRP